MHQAASLQFERVMGELILWHAEQTSPSWPDGFPRKADVREDDVRELHPQPSEDSAFQP